MPTVQNRPLRADDLDAVSGIESRIVGRPRKGFLEKRFAAAAATPDGFIACAALVDGKLAGYAFARLQEGEFGTREAVAVLDVVGVDPDAQGKGIGKAVLADIERRMSERRIGLLRTRVGWADRAMVRFFSSAGFRLASLQIIERDTSPLAEEGDDEENLSRDRVLVRSLRAEDLAAVVRIDRKLTGLDRSAYYAAKFREMLNESGIRVSLASEDDGIVTGFVMARVDFGEFGNVEKTAALDTIGVHPAYGGTGIGHALLSQLLLNLSTLKVESVMVQVSEEDFHLRRFLHRSGFVQSQRLVLTKTVR
jgi:ribosomal protein S18 acetylase RimI-like enzyme